MSHRLKNAMSVVQAIVSQSAPISRIHGQGSDCYPVTDTSPSQRPGYPRPRSRHGSRHRCCLRGALQPMRARSRPDFVGGPLAPIYPSRDWALLFSCTNWLRTPQVWKPIGTHGPSSFTLGSGAGPPSSGLARSWGTEGGAPEPLDQVQMRLLTRIVRAISVAKGEFNTLRSRTHIRASGELIWKPLASTASETIVLGCLDAPGQNQALCHLLDEETKAARCTRRPAISFPDHARSHSNAAQISANDHRQRPIASPRCASGHAR